jgi:hypothetical protein
VSRGVNPVQSLEEEMEAAIQLMMELPGRKEGEGSKLLE